MHKAFSTQSTSKRLYLQAPKLGTNAVSNQKTDMEVGRQFLQSNQNLQTFTTVTGSLLGLEYGGIIGGIAGGFGSSLLMKMFQMGKKSRDQGQNQRPTRGKNNHKQPQHDNADIAKREKEKQNQQKTQQAQSTQNIKFTKVTQNVHDTCLKVPTFPTSTRTTTTLPIKSQWLQNVLQLSARSFMLGDFS